MNKCPICRQCFSSKKDLTSHFIVHTGEKNFKCVDCENAFFTRRELTLHMMIHTYSCEYCQKKFSNKSYLTIHERIHTGVKLYFCELCQISYSTSSDLSRHYTSAGHLNRLKCIKNKVTSISFVDNDEADMKLEIKEETLDEDPLSIEVDTEDVEKSMDRRQKAIHNNVCCCEQNSNK